MLTPCMQCKRHVAEERCPFCGGVAGPRRELPAQTGRVSRAVVLAGALAIPACSGSEPSAPARTTTVAATGGEAAVAQPGDAATAVEPTAPVPADAASGPPTTPPTTPPIDAAAGSAADVGSGGSAAPADAKATGSLTVLAKFAIENKPVARFSVTIDNRKGYARAVVTDGKGRAHFKSIPAGEYTVFWYPDMPNRRTPQPVPRATKKVTVEAGATAEVEITVNRYQDTPIVTPYGAPSVRRRLV